MSNQIGELIANKTLAKKLAICPRTLFTWAADPELNFPQPLKIGFRRYFQVSEIEAWLASRRSGAPTPASNPNAPAIVPNEPRAEKRASLIDRANATLVAGETV
jgi:predicted DNA-binding transcriptional regulator AlpA